MGAAVARRTALSNIHRMIFTNTPSLYEGNQFIEKRHYNHSEDQHIRIGRVTEPSGKYYLISEVSGLLKCTYLYWLNDTFFHLLFF